MILLLIPIVYGLDDCQNPTTKNDIPCHVISSWKYTDCNSTQVFIYNSTPSLISVRNFTDYGIRCNFTWNITQKGSYFWNVTTGDAGRIIIVQEEDNMASLAIMILLMAVTSVIFLMGKNGNFSKNITLSFILKRSLYLVGIYMVTVCMSAAFTFVTIYDMGLENEFRMLLQISHFTAYVFQIVMLFSTIIVALKLWKIDKKNRRMGYND